LLISSLLNVFYLLPVAVSAFFRTSENQQDSSFKEAPWPCVVPILFTAMGCFLLFFWSDVLLQIVGLTP
jgi:NADH:ubiquinone oxidoreductase subunit 5 (subunit L)/multisubunit Na+/H+ antiporter MnhA subunit